MIQVTHFSTFFSTIGYYKILNIVPCYTGFPGGSEVKASAWNAGDPGWIPGVGRSPGEGKGYHFSIPAWKVPRTTQLSDFHFLSL